MGPIREHMASKHRLRLLDCLATLGCSTNRRHAHTKDYHSRSLPHQGCLLSSKSRRSHEQTMGTRPSQQVTLCPSRLAAIEAGLGNLQVGNMHHLHHPRRTTRTIASGWSILQNGVKRRRVNDRQITGRGRKRPLPAISVEVCCNPVLTIEEP